MVIIDEYLYVGTQGGLVRKHIESGEKTICQSWNSPLVGADVLEIEKGINNDLWIGSYNGGLFQIVNGEWHHYLINSTNGNSLSNVKNL